jgi:hypothetical protein
MGDGISIPSPIAFISDIHANIPALKAVLADIAEQGVQRSSAWEMSWAMADSLPSAWSKGI